MKWPERLDAPGRQEWLHGCPCQELARRYGFSARPGCRWPVAKSRGGRPRKRGRALGIDAYSRRKGHRDTTIIVDLDTGRPLTTCTGRRVEDVVAWFHSRPQAALDGVEVGVLAMSKSFYAAMGPVCGEQVEVSDRFHGVQQAGGAREAVWRSGPKHLPPDEAQALKKLRTRWLKLPHQRAVDEWIARADWRRRFPERREVMDWGQDLRQWCERTYAQPARAALWQRMERGRERVLAPLPSVAGT